MENLVVVVIIIIIMIIIVMKVIIMEMQEAITVIVSIMIKMDLMY